LDAFPGKKKPTFNLRQGSFSEMVSGGIKGSGFLNPKTACKNQKSGKQYIYKKLSTFMKLYSMTLYRIFLFSVGLQIITCQ